MMDVERVEVIVRAAMKLHNLCIDHRLGVGDSFDYGVLSTDFTGATDAVCRRVGERLQHESSVFVGAPRAAVDLARHLTSGTRDEETGAPTDESPETAWYDDDIPDDLIPNRTDLEGGPRQWLTDALHSKGVRRPDPRLAAQRIDAARRYRMGLV